MKTLFAFVIIISFSIGNCCAQKGRRLIAIPILKETPLVDSILSVLRDSILADKKYKEYANYNVTIALINRGDADYSFFVGLNDKTQIIETLNRNLEEGHSIGYFKFREFEIFVWSGKQFYTSFSKTGRFKKSSFIYKLDPKRPETWPILGPCWFYRYKDGRFIPDPPLPKS